MFCLPLHPSFMLHLFFVPNLDLSFFMFYTCVPPFFTFGMFKGCGMGPWLVLVPPCFKENEIATCKIGSFFV